MVLSSYHDVRVMAMLLQTECWLNGGKASLLSSHARPFPFLLPRLNTKISFHVTGRPNIHIPSLSSFSPPVRETWAKLHNFNSPTPPTKYINIVPTYHNDDQCLLFLPPWDMMTWYDIHKYIYILKWIYEMMGHEHLEMAKRKSKSISYHNSIGSVSDMLNIFSGRSSESQIFISRINLTYEWLFWCGECGHVCELQILPLFQWFQDI